MRKWCHPNSVVKIYIYISVRERLFCLWLPVTQPISVEPRVTVRCTLCSLRWRSLLYMFFLFFFYHPLPLFSLAALVHALHVRPSCYYKLLGGLTSLIANTDNSPILTQGLTSTGKKQEYERFFTASTRNSFPQTDVSICSNLIFWLIHSSMKGFQIGVR